MKKHTLFYPLICLLALGATSCKNVLTVQARADGSTDVAFYLDMGGTLSQTISALMQSFGASTERGIFSAGAIEEAFDGSDFTNVRVSVPNSQSLALSATMPPFSTATPQPGTLRAADFITRTDSALNVRLSPQTVQALVATLPQDSQGYLDLLMAPVFTGEQMSQAEYQELIAAVYGADWAAELRDATITLTLAAPDGRSLKTAQASAQTAAKPKRSKNTAEFTLPLLEFLTLSDTMQFSVTW